MMKYRLYGSTSSIELRPIDKITKFSTIPLIYNLLEKPLKSKPFIKMNSKNNVFGAVKIQDLYSPSTISYLKKGDYLKNILSVCPFFLIYEEKHKFIEKIPPYILFLHLEQWTDCKDLRTKFKRSLLRFNLCKEQFFDYNEFSFKDTWF